MKLIYEDLALLFPAGYTVKLDNTPASGDVVVLTETPTITTTDELAKAERNYIITSNILVYVRVKDDTADNGAIIYDLFTFFTAIKDKEGSKIGTAWIWGVTDTGGPTYLGRQQENALFSMNMRIRYKI